GLPRPFDVLRRGLGVVRNRDMSPSGRPRHLAQLRDALEDVTAIGHPPISEADDTLQDLRTAASQDNRRVWLLDRLGAAPQLGEAHPLAVQLALVLHSHTLSSP